MKSWPLQSYRAAGWLVLLLATAFPSRAESSPDPFARWEKEINAFETADATQPPEKGAILFLGSSSIRLWKTLAGDFPAVRVINRGFGGSQIVDSTHFADRLVFPHAPRQIVLYAGANDLNAGKSVDQVVTDFQTFVATIRARLPGLPIAFIAISGNPARWSQIEKVRETNARVAAWCEATPGLAFIDTFTGMIGPDGLPRPELFVEDRLHLNAEGYRLWQRIIGPFLTPETN